MPEPFGPSSEQCLLTQEKNTHCKSLRYALSWGFLGMAEALLGQPDEALRHIRKALELVPESRDAIDGPTYAYALAWIYAVNGDKDHAVAELDRLLRKPLNFSVADIRANPGFAKLRGDPRFEKIVTSLAPKNTAGTNQ